VDGWRIKLPGRHLVDPITVVMYALDGPARIVHIWPFEGLDKHNNSRTYANSSTLGLTDHVFDPSSI
jgi:hypothetical protein